MGAANTQRKTELAVAKAKIADVANLGLSGREVAERLGINESTARRWMQEHRRQVNGAPKMSARAAKAAARQMHADGRTNVEIAGELRVDPERVRQWIRTAWPGRKAQRDYHVCVPHAGSPHGFFENLAARGWGYR